MPRPKRHERKTDHSTVVPAYLVEQIRIELGKYPVYEGDIDNFVLDAINRSLSRIAKWERQMGIQAGPKGGSRAKSKDPEPHGDLGKDPSRTA